MAIIAFSKDIIILTPWFWWRNIKIWYNNPRPNTTPIEARIRLVRKSLSVGLVFALDRARESLTFHNTFLLGFINSISHTGRLLRMITKHRRTEFKTNKIVIKINSSIAHKVIHFGFLMGSFSLLECEYLCVQAINIKWWTTTSSKVGVQRWHFFLAILIFQNWLNSFSLSFDCLQQ